MPTIIQPNNELETILPADSRVAIVVSTYHSQINNKLLEGAVRTLTAASISNNAIIVAHVPGAWELPFAVQRLLARRDVAGVISLGTVIKGDTSHDEHINRAVSMALMQLSMDHNKPVALGLLTVNNLEQAIQRSGGTMGNKGEEAAGALLECLKIGFAIDQNN